MTPNSAFIKMSDTMVKLFVWDDMGLYDVYEVEGAVVRQGSLTTFSYTNVAFSIFENNVLREVDMFQLISEGAEGEAKLSDETDNTISQILAELMRTRYNVKHALRAPKMDDTVTDNPTRH